MTDKIDDILALTYEIEGLLLLYQNRGTDRLPETVSRLLESKSRKLADILSLDTSPEDISPEYVSPATPTSVTPSPVIDNSSERIAETVAYEQEEDSEPDAGTPDAYATKLNEAQAEEDEADAEAAEEMSSNEGNVGNIDRMVEDGAAIMKLFTLNERFLFARELFGGNLNAQKIIIEAISQFRTIDEVKNYLINNQGLNPENQYTQDFIDKLTPYFNK